MSKQPGIKPSCLYPFINRKLLAFSSHRMRGGRSKVFHTPVQQLGLPLLPKRKNIWKKFRHLLTSTWVTKRTN